MGRASESGQGAPGEEGVTAGAWGSMDCCSIPRTSPHRQKSRGRALEEHPAGAEQAREGGDKVSRATKDLLN